MAHARTPKKIGIVTGSRAEYGLLRWLLQEIANDETFELSLFVTGMHLSPEFGLTKRAILEDGFTITSEIEMLLSSDTSRGVAKSVGVGVLGFADTFAEKKPDIVVLLGDRFEIFAATQAALFSRIPIAHLHGGEVTQGAFDESLRHAITKMSHLHFVAADEYAKRVCQLGENPANVFNVGALGLDSVRRMTLLSRSEIEMRTGFRFADKNLLVTFHPETLARQSSTEALNALFKALDAHSQYNIMITKPNADTEGRAISEAIDTYASKNKERVFVSTSLGQLNYLSMVKECDAVVGNSSSGVIEVPYLKKPTVNIGNRQAGRILPSSVVNCEPDAIQIEVAIRRAVSAEHLQTTTLTTCPFGDGTASIKIKHILKTIDLQNITVKKFFDLKGEL